LSGPGAALLHALAICAEIGSAGGFRLSCAVSVLDTHGAAVGRVSVVVAGPARERHDA